MEDEMGWGWEKTVEEWQMEGRGKMLLVKEERSKTILWNRGLSSLLTELIPAYAEQNEVCLVLNCTLAGCDCQSPSHSHQRHRAAQDQIF